jgi:hypothetical protein
MEKKHIALIIALVTTILGAVGWSSTWKRNGSPGTGEKIGQIVKINKQGTGIKTWEAELVRGGMNGGSGAIAMTPPFDFTIEDDELAAKAEKHMREQTEVIIKYRIEMFYSAWRSESNGVFLESIEPAAPPK